MSQTLVFSDSDAELQINTSTGTNDLLVTGDEGQRVVAAFRGLKNQIPTLRRVVWDVPGGGIVGRLTVSIGTPPKELALNFTSLTLPSPDYYYVFNGGAWTEAEIRFLDEIKTALLQFSVTHTLTAVSGEPTVPVSWFGATNYWKLEEAADPWVDSLGSNNLLHVVPFPVPTRVAGKRNFAAQMPVGSISILKSVSTFNWTGAFSLAFWYSPDVGADRGILDNEDFGIYFGWSNPGFFGIGINSGSPIEFVGTQSAPAAMFHHVVITGIGYQTKVYVNGVLDITVNKAPASTAGSLRIYNGTFDEAQLYSRELSAAEVSTLYNGGSGAFL